MDFSNLSFDEIFFPEMTGWLLAAKIFFILFNFGVIAFIIYVWATTIYLRRLFIWDLVEFFTFRAYNVKLIDKEWRRIKKRLITQRPVEMKLAIVEAAALMNDVLARQGYGGKNLSDKLANSREDVFSDLDMLKEADRLYRRLVKNPAIQLDYQAAKSAILSFEQGFKDISAFRDK
jgi:hypothetical protein